MSLVEELNSIASSLNDYIVNKKIESLAAVAKNVAKSFSGSWIGYHSRIYYENFQPTPAGANFSPEWGLTENYSGGCNSIGHWKEYSFDDVVNYIYRTSDNQDLSLTRIESENAKKHFEDSKEAVLSLIHANFSSNIDTFLQKHIGQIQECKTFTIQDCINVLKPKGSFVSRDSLAYTQGQVVPPHCCVIAEAVSLDSPYKQSDKLKSLIHKLVNHIKNIERVEMSNNNSNSQSQEYLHVLVETVEKTKEHKNHEYIALDISDKAKIINKIIKPFKSKSGVVEIDGYHLNPTDITRILIHSSEINSNAIGAKISTSYNKEAELNAQQNVFIPIPVITSKIIFSAKDYMQNITDDIIEAAEQQLLTTPTTGKNIVTTAKRFFISHCVKDAQFAKYVMELLEAMGVKAEEIFCCSADGNGIPIGHDWKTTLHKELNEDSFVIFLLTDNFFDSPICLCEMGATWIMTKTHAPILIPPMNYDKLKGVLATSQGFMINDQLRWTLLKEQLGFSEQHTIWERKRNDILGRMEHTLSLIGVPFPTMAFG